MVPSSSQLAGGQQLGAAVATRAAEDRRVACHSVPFRPYGKQPAIVRALTAAIEVNKDGWRGFLSTCSAFLPTED